MRRRLRRHSAWLEHTGGWKSPRREPVDSDPEVGLFHFMVLRVRPGSPPPTLQSSGSLGLTLSGDWLAGSLGVGTTAGRAVCLLTLTAATQLATRGNNEKSVSCQHYVIIRKEPVASPGRHESRKQDNAEASVGGPAPCLVHSRPSDRVRGVNQMKEQETQPTCLFSPTCTYFSHRAPQTDNTWLAWNSVALT